MRILPTDHIPVPLGLFTMASVIGRIYATSTLAIILDPKTNQLSDKDSRNSALSSVPLIV